MAEPREGIWLCFEIELTAAQLSAMPPQTVAALLRGVADILTARQYAALAVVPETPPHRGPPASPSVTSSEPTADSAIPESRDE